MMMKFKHLALVILMMGCFAAGAQKIAHVNFDSLVLVMPETKIATEAAQNYLKSLQQEVIAMQTELETKYKKYTDEEATMSDLVKRTQMETLQNLQQRLQEFQRSAEEDYKRKQAELTQPIFEKAKKGIEAVARENGYKYVLDTSPSNNTVLFFESSDDIFALVKKKLESMPPAQIPGATPPQKQTPPQTQPQQNKPANQTPATPKKKS